MTLAVRAAAPPLETAPRGGYSHTTCPVRWDAEHRAAEERGVTDPRGTDQQGRYTRTGREREAAAIHTPPVLTAQRREELTHSQEPGAARILPPREIIIIHCHGLLRSSSARSSCCSTHAPSRCTAPIRSSSARSSALLACTRDSRSRSEKSVWTPSQRYPMSSIRQQHRLHKHTCPGAMLTPSCAEPGESAGFAGAVEVSSMRGLRWRLSPSASTSSSSSSTSSP